MTINWSQILKSKYFRIILTNSLLTSFVLIILSLNGIFELAELDAFDHFFRKRPERDFDPNIVLIGVTEADINYLKGWPISDQKLTQILEEIKKQNPRVIGLDIVRDYPVMEGYSELADFFINTPNIIGIEGVSIASGKIKPPPVLAELNQVAMSDLIQDKDGIIRRAYLTINFKGNSGKKDSLAATLALRYLEKEGIKIEDLPNRKYSSQLGKSIFHLFKSNDGAYTKTKVIGSQILINYRGNSCTLSRRCKFSFVSVQDLLENKINSDLFKDKVVILGVFASSLRDFHNTPYSNSDDAIFSGIEIYAHITSQLIEAAQKGNVIIQTWYDIGEWSWLFGWTILGSVFGVYTAKKRLIAIGLIPASFSLYGVTYWLFVSNIWIPFVMPMVGLIGAAIATTIYVLWQDLRDYTKNLEFRVKERTLALQKINGELENRNEDLSQAREVADAANRAKSQFLANMSHELRTPLNAILGFSQLMTRDHHLTITQDTYLSIINRSGEHLLSLINDVLDMSKIEAGRMTLNPKSFDLYQTLEIIEEMFALRASEKNLILQSHCCELVPQYIEADEKKIRQILLNLLSNALKFTQEGSITLSVQCLDLTQDQCRLKFSVTDTGAGISTEQLPLVFEAFTQTDSGIQSNQGTGLGLPISRKFVQMMGGDMGVTSEVGIETTFFFDIRVKVVSEDMINSNPVQPRIKSLAPNQPDYRILIVDDHWINRKLLDNILTNIGFSIEEAQNGMEAVSKWQEWQPDLIWMDIRMPVMDGYQATQKIRQLEQQNIQSQNHDKLTIIIALTASILDEDKILVKKSGCNDFVRKPFQEVELLEKMQHYLQLEYLYEDTSEMLHQKSRHFAQSDEAVLRQQIGQLSKELIDNLAQAALIGDDLGLLDITKTISADLPELKQTLENWINEFRFDRISELLKQTQK